MADEVRTFETGIERQEGQRPSRMDVIPAGPTQQLYAWRHDSIPGKRLASKKLGFVPAVVEDAGGTGSAVGGGDEIVIRTAALAIHVPPGASEDHIARVLAAVSRSE